MKIKTLNGLFAATAFSIMFANASIAANAEELPDESAVVSEQEGSGQTEQTQEPENPVSDDGTSDQTDTAQDKGDGTQGESGTDNVPDSNQNDISLPESGVPVQDTAGGTGEQPEESIAGGQIAGPADGEQPSGSNSGEASKLPDSGPEGEGGDNSESKDDGAQESGPASFEEAKDNLDKAKEDEEQAKSELDGAQAGADSARDDVDKAQQEVQEAEKELDQAQEKKEEAGEQKDKADEEAARAEQEADAAQKELDGALQDANVSKDDFENVQQDLEEKKNQQDAAQQTVNEAEADCNDKKAEADAAAAAVEEAGKNAANAENDKNIADQAVADAQKEVNSAQEAYDNALNASGVDASTANEASENLKKAQEVLEAVKNKVASGSLGFFQYLGEAGSDSARVAAAILTASNQSEAPGTGTESQWTADSWDAFTAYTHLGEANDATSLENMRKTIAFLKECNELRVSDNNFSGLSALQVNDALMAIAQLNANWATWTADNKYNSHSKVFNVGENLAWYYVDVPGLDDPFDGWYYEEKESYEKKDGGVTGHYLNITEAGYSATGFAINISEDSRGQLRLNCAQEFSSDSNVNYYGYGQCYSVEEYETRFMAYYNAVMKELSDAQAAYDAALAAYNQAVSGGGGQNQALIDSKKAELDKATDGLEAAKINAEEKLEILNNAQEALAASVEKNTAAQAAYEQSRGNLETAQSDLQAKKEAYEAALKDIEDNFGTAVVRAAENLLKYKAEYNRALAAQDEAAVVYEEAEAVWAAALDRKTAADQNLQEKTDILTQKLQVLQDARDAYQEALARLNVAQSDYDRLKPQEEASSGSDGGEAGYAEAARANTVAVLNLSSINSRKATFSKGCSFKYFLDYTTSFIKDSSLDNLTIDCSDVPWYSFNKKILETLRANSDKALTVVFRYKGRKYTFTIPAGYDLDLLQDSRGWYGFMYLKTVFGGYEVV